MKVETVKERKKQKKIQLKTINNLDKEFLHWIYHQALVLAAVEKDKLQAPHSKSIANNLDELNDRREKLILLSCKVY